MTTRCIPPVTRLTSWTVAVLVAFAATTAFAQFDVRDNGVFEPDGDSYSNFTPTPLDDTDMIYLDSQTGGPYEPKTTGAFVQAFIDDADQPDATHHAKSHKDTLPISQWTRMRTPNVTDKADLQQVFAAVYSIDVDGNGPRTVLTGRAVRDCHNGDTNLGMRLLKTDVQCILPADAGSAPFTWSDGEVVLVAEFTSSCKVGTVRAYRWTDPNDWAQRGTDNDGDEYLEELLVIFDSRVRRFGDCADTVDEDGNPLRDIMCAMVTTDDNNPPDGTIAPSWAPDTKPSANSGRAGLRAVLQGHGGPDRTDRLRGEHLHQFLHHANALVPVPAFGPARSRLG